MQGRHQLILDYYNDRKNLNQTKEIQWNWKFLIFKRNYEKNITAF